MLISVLSFRILRDEGVNWLGDLIRNNNEVLVFWPQKEKEKEKEKKMRNKKHQLQWPCRMVFLFFFFK